MLAPTLVSSPYAPGSQPDPQLTPTGGSLRIPAACTGIFTLRPSLGRFPTARCRSGLAGQEAVVAVNGPMTLSLNDLELYCQAVLSAEPWLADPRCLPIPWRPVSLPPRLRIGVLWNDGIVAPTPPVRRALTTAAARLRAAGHEVVDWPPDDHRELLQLLGAMFVADGGRTVRAALEPTGEPFREEMAMYRAATELGTYDMWQLQLARSEAQKRYLDRWNAAGLDVVLAPTTPYASVRNGSFKHLGYTGVYNVLDYAATSFPTGLVADKELDQKASDFTPLSPLDQEVHTDCKFIAGVVGLSLTSCRRFRAGPWYADQLAAGCTSARGGEGRPGHPSRRRCVIELMGWH